MTIKDKTDEAAAAETASASTHAAALSKLGAAKGGRARASTMTDRERKDNARKASLARWKKERADFEAKPPTETKAASKALAAGLPYSMFQGEITIVDSTYPVHVLNDGRRVIAQREIVRILSPAGRDSGGLQPYIDNIPLENKNLDLGANSVKFQVPSTQFISHGYHSTFLIDICSAYLDARDQDKLKQNQLGLAKRAEIFLRACAKVGIEALIDEATGYDKFKKKREYQLKLQAFIADDMQEWVKTFPDEFWIELARLEGVHYSPRHRPLRWGKYVIAFVYEAIDKEMTDKIRAIVPDPEHGRNLHQMLTGFGKEKVIRQLWQVITIMKLCDNMRDFKAKFSHVFQHSPLQMSFADF